jgi:LmbE family N-acetylglucosaminyl deacetylase
VHGLWAAVDICGKIDGVVDLAIVSPHLDDAVLSCTRLLEGHPASHLITVFAGGPERVQWISGWDRAAGFAEGDDVMAVRRGEDSAVGQVLQVTTHHLPYWDGQYRGLEHGYTGPESSQDLIEHIAIDLIALVDRLDVQEWLIPLGIFHLDHHLTAAACRQVALARPERSWIAYEELPYSFEEPESRRSAWQTVEGDLLQGGFMTEIRRRFPDTSKKRRVIRRYGSQTKALGPERLRQIIRSPERYHRLEPR